MSDKITIKKIAELAGVSSATVSKVLNNTGRYSDETKDRILNLVKELDYRPNAVAKSLRTRKSKTIGVIVPDITNEFFARIVLAIEKYCDPQGYSVFICNSDEKEEKEIQYLKELEIKGVDGLIYLSANDKLFKTNTLLPIVCIDRKPMQQNVATVTSDNVHGGRLAATELINSGCKNILLIRDYRDVFPTVERIKGFEKVLQENNLQLKDVLEVEIVGIEQSQEAVENYLKEKKIEFDGIFATTDGLAYGAKLALQAHGINVPKDVKIVGYDNITLAKYTSLTSINQNKELLGDYAAEKIINMIERGNKTKNFMSVPVELVKRGST